MQNIGITWVASEFYYMLAVEKLVKPVMYNPVHRKAYTNFVAYRERFTKLLKQRMYDYIALTCAGEARHASHKCSHKIVGFDITGGVSRDDIWSSVVAYDPQQVLKACVEIYSYNWNSGFGGIKWKHIAEHGTLVNQEDAVVWIDHCFDLQHNGGTFFDKQANLFRNESGVKNILDQKLNILSQDLIKSLRISPRLASLSLDLIKSKLLNPFDVKVMNAHSICDIDEWENIQWGYSDCDYSIVDRGKDYDDDEDDYYEDDDEDDEDEEKITPVRTSLYSREDTYTSSTREIK